MEAKEKEQLMLQNDEKALPMGRAELFSLEAFSYKTTTLHTMQSQLFVQGCKGITLPAKSSTRKVTWAQTPRE
jgi:hypothetical protein